MIEPWFQLPFTAAARDWHRALKTCCSCGTRTLTLLSLTVVLISFPPAAACSAVCQA